MAKQVDEYQAKITADDQASKVIDDVAAKGQALAEQNAQITVDATDDASAVLDEDASKVESLDGATADISTQAEDNAAETLQADQDAVDALDGSTPTITPEVTGTAEEDLQTIASEADALDGASPTITPQVDSTGAQSKMFSLGGAVDFVAGKFSAGGVDVKSMTSALGGSETALGGVAGSAIPAAAGIAAVTGIVHSSISDFASLASEVNTFKEKTGASADESSRWISVGNDLGVSQDAIAAGISRVSREIDQGKLKQYGIEGGTVNEQFKQIIAYIEAIPDANQRAKVSFDVFGRSYLALAPLLDTTENIGERLKNVNPGEILTDADIQKWRNFRDASDELGHSIEAVKNAIGEIAVGPLTDLLDVVNGLTKAGGEINDAIPSWIKTVGEDIAKYNPIIAPYTLGLQALHEAAGLFKGGDADVTVISQSGIQATKDGTTAVTDYTAAAKDATEALNAQKTAADDAAKAIHGITDAMLASSDDQFAYNKAQREAAQALDDLPAAVDKVNNSNADAATKQREINQLYDDAAQKAVTLAQSQAKLKEDTEKASGATVTEAEHLDNLNASLLTSAASTSGPVKQSIIDHIAAINGIPPEKVTEILASTPNLDEQKALLDEASKNRSLTITAQLITATATQQYGAWVAQIVNNPPTITPRINMPFGSAGPQGMSGGPVNESGFWTVGEAGPETVFLPAGAHVETAGDRMNRMAGSGGNTVINYNITVNAPPLTSPADVGQAAVNAIKAFERRSGPGWRSGRAA